MYSVWTTITVVPFEAKERVVATWCGCGREGRRVGYRGQMKDETLRGVSDRVTT